MDIKQLKDLISFVDKQRNIGEVNIEVDKKYKVFIKQKGVFSKAVVETVPTAFPSVKLPTESIIGTSEGKELEASANTFTIKSPIVGTFFRKPNPSKPNFVEEGDLIEVGKVVCTIEVLKTYNSIISEVSGRIVKFLVEDNSPVGFDQPLCIVELL
ncbi:MAG: acetyl-CoA carboxylase biotin carboxyl carrier protein [Chitinophagaceae bacterium]